MVNRSSPILGRDALDPIELEGLLEQAGLRRNGGMMALANAAMLARNPSWRERLLKVLRPRLAVVQGAHPFAPSPNGELKDGDFNFGQIVWADGSLAGPAKLNAGELTAGVLCTGSTNSGKTRAVASLLRQAVRQCPTWIFDPHHEYHHFLADEIRNGTVLVMDYKRVKFNISEVVLDEPPPEGIGRVAAVFRRTTFIRDGGENLIRTALRQLYQDYGVFDGAEDYPSVFDLRQAMAKMKYRVSLREAEYHSAVMNRLDGLITQLGQTLDCSRGFPIAQLLERSIIFRVGGMDAMTYGFFVDSLLSAALAYRRLHAS